MQKRFKIALLITGASLLMSLFGQVALGTPVMASVDDKSLTWKLSWADEFNGANGAPVNSSKWEFDTGGKWGNGTELQYYTDRTANASQLGGNLVITATKESYGGNAYTSARVKTYTKFSQTYGRFEARVIVPTGQGIWPAFWILGNDIYTSGWPKCGEVDLMEHVNNETRFVGSVHMPSTVASEYKTGTNFDTSSDPSFYTKYHVYAVEWEPTTIRYYVDNLLYKTVNKAQLPVGAVWVFDHPFYIILNVAVGGNWPGSPDSTTVWPARMVVDYVRVYSR
ncbi:MAG TPA: glycoside hydrolase family 16 protein [Anaerolineae bacterium]